MKEKIIILGSGESGVGLKFLHKNKEWRFCFRFWKNKTTL